MSERGLLRVVVGLLGFVPVLAGLAGVIVGPAMAGLAASATPLSLDSHTRYLSGLLLGIGLGFWSTIPSIAQQTARFRLLTAIVFAGGLARLLGLVLAGVPPAPMLGGLAMELVVTPLLCVWQARVARQGRKPGSLAGVALPVAGASG